MNEVDLRRGEEPSENGELVAARLDPDDTILQWQ